MRGLITGTIITIVTVAVGFATSILVTVDLDDRVGATAERGLEEGYVEGHEEGWQEGSREGYQEGSRLGYEEALGGDYDIMDQAGFYFLYNPTYDEMQEVLAEDTKRLAKAINNDAETHGIRAAYVRCRIVPTDGEGKVYLLALLAFQTVDKGFIFIEPSSHREVTLEIGRRYSELNEFSTIKHDGIISDIRIIW